jgi:hypothetical protein
MGGRRKEGNKSLFLGEETTAYTHTSLTLVGLGKKIHFKIPRLPLGEFNGLYFDILSFLWIAQFSEK